MRPEFQHPLDPMFNPRAIAVFGATEKRGHIGRQVFSDLVSGGFDGHVFAINPKYDIVQGKPCHADLGEIEHPIDLALICTPPKRLNRVLAQCEAHRVGHAVLLPHPSQNEPSDTIQHLVEKSTMRILGPNSVGLARPWIRLNAAHVAGQPPRGPLAVISQSASLCSAISDWATPHHLGLSALVSLGDGTKVTLGELIEFFADDPKTEAILLYVDHIADGAAFVSSLRYATWRKPVVVLKSRTASADTEDAVFDAVLTRTGAIRAHTFGQLFASAEILSSGHRAKGKNLVIASNSHATACLASDRAASRGLAIKDGRFEPFHIGTCGEVFERILRDEATDCLLAMLIPKPGMDPKQVAQHLITAARSGPRKPVLACWMGDSSVADARHALSAAGIPDFTTPENAVDAFHVLHEHKKQSDLALEVPGPRVLPNADETQARNTIARALAAGRTRLNTDDVSHALSSVGLPVAEKDQRYDAAAPRARLQVAQDPVFGRYIRISQASEHGGAAYAIPPLTSVLADRLISRSGLHPALSEDTTCASQARQALIQILQQVSDLICELPEVTSLRTTVMSAGTGALGLANTDISIGKPDPDEPHLSVAPYPEQYVTHEAMPDGADLVIRPIRAEDAEQEDDFVAQLSPKSKRLRFFGAIQTLSPRQLARFTQLDFRRELALVAVLHKEAAHHQIAVARYYILPSGKDAEFAVVVHDDYQRKGIATKLMHRLRDAAKAQNIARLRGTVLTENTGMLSLTRSLGCRDYFDPSEPDVMQVVLDLN